MSTNSVFDWSDVAGSNTDVAGNGIAGSSNISLGNDVFQNIMAQIAAGLIERGSDIATASTISFTGATTRALTHDLTGTTTVTAVTLTAGHWRICRAQGAFQLTASSTLVVNGSTSTNYTTTAGDLLVFFGYSSSTVRVWTFSGGGVSAATNAQALGGTLTTVSVTPANLAQERALGVQPVNLGLAASVAASALTISLKGIDGADPSATNPVTIPFRNATAATGTPSYLTITSALSLTISSGSTLGMTSAVAATLTIVMFNDGGTARLGIMNPVTTTLNDGIASSTAEGGAGAADSADVIYTGTAVSSKAYTVIGYATVTEAAAGTWATAPATLQVASAAAARNAVLTGRITLGTATASTSGTSIDFTGIPAGVRRIKINLVGVTTSGSSLITFQLGDSGGIEATGYLGTYGQLGGSGSGNPTIGFELSISGATNVVHGTLTLELENATSNTWVATGQFGISNSAALYWTAGRKSTSATLDRVRVTTAGGTDTFGSGEINISYEF